MAENEVRKILGDLTNKENEYEESPAIKQVLPAPDMPFDLAQVKLEDEGDIGYKNETGSGNESHSQTPNGVLLKLSYCNQNRVMSSFPQNFRALKQHVGVLFKLSRPFTLFYIDPTGDRVDVESNKDLRGIQAIYANSRNRIVKLHVWLQEVPLPVMPTGIPAADELAQNIRDETKLVHFNDKTRSLANSSGAENMVTRQNISFILEYAYGNRFYYRCWKAKDGCKGMWKIGKCGGEGKLCRDHTLNSCGVYQTQVAQQIPQNVSDNAQPVFSIQQELSRPTINHAQVLPLAPQASAAPKIEEIATMMSKIKRALRELLPRNMYTAKPEFINNLLRLYPEFSDFVPMINVMYCLVKEGIRCEAKANNMPTSNVVLPSLPLPALPQKADANDVTTIRTSRGTSFGRAQIRSLCEDTCHELVMLISDFELNIVKSNYKAPQRYLLS